jgi:hypothetical protein
VSPEEVERLSTLAECHGIGFDAVAIGYAIGIRVRERATSWDQAVELLDLELERQHR